jgi:hypothetical protein
MSQPIAVGRQASSGKGTEKHQVPGALKLIATILHVSLVTVLPELVGMNMLTLLNHKRGILKKKCPTGFSDGLVLHQ